MVHDSLSITNRDFELDFLDQDTFQLSRDPLIALDSGPSLRSKLRARRGRFIEKNLLFDRRVVDFKPPISLEGYFQSEKYFLDAKDVIAHDFRAREESLPSALRELRKEISTKKTLAIHVRRGDYVSNRNARSFHGIPSPDYYRKALEILQAERSFDTVFVFSDDPEWVSSQSVFSHFNIVQPSNEKSIWDLWIMSAARDFIIANSSYSWWAAWLSQARHKRVIAPRPWFLQKEQTDSDLIPDSWVRVGQ